MSQYDFATINPATTSGTALATLLGSFRTALESQHSGSSRPAYAIAGTLWLDTVGTPWILKLYDGAEDISLGTINATTNIFTLTAGAATLESIDAGAGAGPIMTIYRNSPSPAVSDVIGQIIFQGEDSAGNIQTYADIFAQIIDPTSGSEDANLLFRNVVAGTVTTQGSVTATGWNGMNIGATTPGAGSFTTLANTGGAIISGTWTPTITNVANVASSTPSSSYYSRVGDAVTCWGLVNIDPTAAVQTTFRIGLPIASNFVGNELEGTMHDGAAGHGRISTDVTNNEASATYTSSGTAAVNFAFHFSYMIV